MTQHSHAPHHVSAGAIGLVAGAWLIVAPSVLHLTAPQAFWNDGLMGVVILVLSLILTYTRQPPELASWLAVLAGAWLVASSFILKLPVDHANELVVGIIVIVAGVLSSDRVLGVLPERFQRYF